MQGRRSHVLSPGLKMEHMPRGGDGCRRRRPCVGSSCVHSCRAVKEVCLIGRLPVTRITPVQGWLCTACADERLLCQHACGVKKPSKSPFDCLCTDSASNRAANEGIGWLRHEVPTSYCDGVQQGFIPLMLNNRINVPRRCLIWRFHTVRSAQTSIVKSLLLPV